MANRLNVSDLSLLGFLLHVSSRRIIWKQFGFVCVGAKIKSGEEAAVDAVVIS